MSEWDRAVREGWMKAPVLSQTEVDTQQLRFVGLGIIPPAGSELISKAADELDALRKAADGVLKAYMPQFSGSREVDDCLVALAVARRSVAIRKEGIAHE